MKAKDTMQAEAEALERGAEILAQSQVTPPDAGPAVAALEKALEVLLRKEAERMRFELRGKRSIAHLFPDTESTPA